MPKEDRKVLVLDDSYDLSSLLSEHLSSSGLDSDWVNTYNEAIKKSESNDYKVLILDWNLDNGNDKNGADFARWYKSNKSDLVYVVMYSAYDIPENDREVADVCFAKDSKELPEIIRVTKTLCSKDYQIHTDRIKKISINVDSLKDRVCNIEAVCRNREIILARMDERLVSIKDTVETTHNDTQAFISDNRTSKDDIMKQLSPTRIVIMCLGIMGAIYTVIGGGSVLLKLINKWLGF